MARLVVGCVLVLAQLALAAPPRRAPHHNAMRLSDQLLNQAHAAQQKLKTMPRPKTAPGRTVWSGVVDFADEVPRLRRALTRWLIDRKPALGSLDRLNQIAWSVHRQLDRAPAYRGIHTEWARVVTALRALNKAIGRLR